MKRAEAVTIVGVGNWYRRDDGVGIAVARRLRGRLPSGVRIVEVSGGGTALLDTWKDAATVVIVDAVQSGARPGTIHRLDAHAGQIPSSYFHCSTHAFNVAEAVELARALGQLPPCMIVFGIEGKDVTPGIGLSAEVQEAAGIVTERLLAECLIGVGATSL